MSSFKFNWNIYDLSGKVQQCEFVWTLRYGLRCLKSILTISPHRRNRSKLVISMAIDIKLYSTSTYTPFKFLRTLHLIIMLNSENPEISI